MFAVAGWALSVVRVTTEHCLKCFFSLRIIFKFIQIIKYWQHSNLVKLSSRRILLNSKIGNLENSQYSFFFVSEAFAHRCSAECWKVILKFFYKIHRKTLAVEPQIWNFKAKQVEQNGVSLKRTKKITQIQIHVIIPFFPNAPFPFPLKTSENLSFQKWETKVNRWIQIFKFELIYFCSCFQ